MLRKITFTFAFLTLAACGHHRDVRPGTSGLHKVVVVTEDKEMGARSAIEQAEHFCKQTGKMAAFEDENQKYTGDMDEESYKKGKRMSKVAKVVGGSVAVFGGRNESAVGSIVGLGGLAGDAALGKGYTVTMSFRCQ